jgi:hypothetical protein
MTVRIQISCSETRTQRCTSAKRVAAANFHFFNRALPFLHRQDRRANPTVCRSGERLESEDDSLARLPPETENGVQSFQRKSSLTAVTWRVSTATSVGFALRRHRRVTLFACGSRDGSSSASSWQVVLRLRRTLSASRGPVRPQPPALVRFWGRRLNIVPNR